MDEFEFKGFWWLPEAPDDKIAGFLIFNPKASGKLELIGTFKNINNLNITDKNAFTSPPIILGKSLEGKYITLYRCFESSFSMSFPGISRSVFLVNIIFIGCHFEKEEDILFDEITIDYSNMNEWVGISGFKRQHEFNQEDHLKKYEISYEYPNAIPIELEVGFIYLSFHLDSRSNLAFSFNLSQDVYFRVVPKIPQSIRWYLDTILDNLRDFMTLAIGRASFPKKIIGKSKEYFTKLSNGKIVLDNISIYHKIGPLFDMSKTIYPHEMLFTLKDILSNFNQIMNNWIKKSEILQPVYDLYFATLYNPSLHLNYQFLSLAQALESYHRRIFGGKYISDNAYESQRIAFINAIFPETEQSFKESLTNKIQYMNEFSLIKRLKVIMTKFSKIISSIVSSQEIFVRDIKNTRDYLTHYDERLESERKKGQDLYWLVQKMRYIVAVCLLSEIGIDNETIKILITRNQRISELLSH